MLFQFYHKSRKNQSVLGLYPGTIDLFRDPAHNAIMEPVKFFAMKINKILIVPAIVLMVFVGINLSRGEADIHNYAGENILYTISPLGESEYKDLGVTDLKGSKVNLVTCRTKILFFEDTEKIYSDPDNLLPIKVERDISKLWIKEYVTEEYDQKKFTVTLRKFKGDKVIDERIVKSRGPINNALTLPFNMRRETGLKIGWQFTVRIPNDEFKVALVSIDEITIPAGKFQAYHFKSIPDKGEMWINKNNPRVTLKIKGKGLFNYVLAMKKYSLSK